MGNRLPASCPEMKVIRARFSGSHADMHQRHAAADDVVMTNSGAWALPDALRVKKDADTATPSGDGYAGLPPYRSVDRRQPDGNHATMTHGV
jgi:hypothetical protein